MRSSSARRTVAATWSRNAGVTPRSSVRAVRAGAGHQTSRPGTGHPATATTGAGSVPPRSAAVRSASTVADIATTTQVVAQVRPDVDQQGQGEVVDEVPLVDLVEDDRARPPAAPGRAAGAAGAPRW